ncbi:alginate export family protein [Sphingomonas sp. HITSZ_GF]|uniref:alginate export family protein n=1 Tax=Sphingomonas sp. HITSZ_GF TaxID=3037247 RepID=UPI00240E8283|nr:alginate export family protein [Sphingomonas sp. HITSZ_GF]MDG2535149.1 alginate export family protein [Sphingomonas sp. HITSZ_GF]
MRHALFCAAGLLVPAAAHAQQVKLMPTAEVRLRYEHVDQGGLPEDADAVTLRVRPGLAASWKRWSALVEGEGVIALATGYNDGTNGKTRYPLVVDPENIELNRAQLRYAGKDGLAFTAGRQRLNFADDRFVGTAPWRQSEQTYDAVRFQYGKPLGLNADIAYSWSVRTVNGRNGTGARPVSIGGDNLFAVLGYGTGAGTLSAFAYLVDQDQAAVQGFRLSSQTYGVRFAGKQTLAKQVSLGYVASWARQSDWHRNPNRYTADYWLGELNLTARALSLTAGYEVLGADKGAALTSVQTPLASYFKFNGWAGKFGTTPPAGLRDRYGTVGYGWKQVGPLDAITLGATWHRFDSDRQGQHYGDELDLIAGVKRGRYALSARYAHYRADRFATDTDKLWLQLDWSL